MYYENASKVFNIAFVEIICGFVARIKVFLQICNLFSLDCIAVEIIQILYTILNEKQFRKTTKKVVAIVAFRGVDATDHLLSRGLHSR